MERTGGLELQSDPSWILAQYRHPSQHKKKRIALKSGPQAAECFGPQDQSSA